MEISSDLSAERVVRALAALAQEHRLACFRWLVEAGPDGMAAGSLAEALGIPNSSLSFHLTQLSHAGLIQQRRVGRSIIYAACYPAMNALLAYLTENCCAGVDCSADAACSDTNEAKERKVA